MTSEVDGGDGFDTYNGLGTGVGLESRWMWAGINRSCYSLVAGAYGGQQLRVAQVSVSSTFVTYPFLTFAPGGVGQFSMTVGVTISVVANIFASGGSNCPRIMYLSNTTPMFSILFNGDGSISLARSTVATNPGGGASTDTILGTTVSSLMLDGVRKEVELIVNTISDTVGSMELKVDGVSRLTLTNVDNKNGTPTTVDIVALPPGTANGTTTFNIDYDDMRWNLTNASLPPMRATALPLTTETGTIAWTPSTGTDNTDVLDETLADASDYVQTSTVGDTDLYNKTAVATAVGFTPANLYAVQLIGFGLRTDVTVRTTYFTMHNGGGYNDGSAITLAQSPGMFMDRFMNQDPFTAADWVTANIDSYTAGLKVAS